jgi:hypothetical protein
MFSVILVYLKHLIEHLKLNVNLKHLLEQTLHTSTQTNLAREIERVMMCVCTTKKMK